MSEMEGEMNTVAERESHLNEAALLLIGLNPGDLNGVVRLDGLLNAYLADCPADSPDRLPITDAAAAVADVIVGERKFAEGMEAIGKLLERAMNELDQPSPASARQPAEPPAAAEKSEVPSPAPTFGIKESAPAAAAANDQPVERVPEDADLLPDFIGESIEYLEAAEGALLALEADPTDQESVNVVFRAFHTVKGTSGFLGLERIQELAHHAESLLSRVRDGEIAFVGGVADLSLRASDLLKAVIQLLRSAEPGSEVLLPAEYAHVLQILSAPDAVLASDTVPGPDDAIAEAEAEDTAASAAEPSKAATRRAPPEADADHSVRVRTDRLDRLVDLVGELVVAQAMVTQDPHVGSPEGVELAKKIVQAGKIVRELQDLSMGLRMVPFRPAFQKITRVVRDVSKKSAKQVEFVTEGEDTEIDRSMVDIISDPLVHMIRNAIDHGLELPHEREAAGKPARGVLRLTAYQQGGGVVIELSDDGRGLNRDKILAKAVEKGLVEPDRVLLDHEVYALIFAPGFSTAEKVTDLSGRGVGMDVVRRSIESLHGRVEIDSKPGAGTSFRIVLPLTLAITDGMLTRVGNERYIIPTVSIETSLRPTPEVLSSVHGRGEMVLLHGRVVPIVRLHQLFEISGAATDPTRALLVVVGEGASRIALLVDELLGQQQFVAKPLGDGIGRVEGLAGGAVLGDGKVGLILDCAEVIALSRARGGSEARAA
jgi:two-component system, chemotaxis family, sensor kinase CheA